MAVPDLVLLSFIGGLAVALLTAPVGVSGAVFLLPIQISVLQIPSPAVTPTNLLFNIVAAPGALARYRTQASLHSALTVSLLIGTLPGVVIGACVRVFLIPGPEVFRIMVAGFLFPVGLRLLLRPRRVPTPDSAPLAGGLTIGIALIVGVIGGIYGIGGGSLLSPILVGHGVAVATVAPATLVCTLITSLVGAATYAILAIVTTGLQVAPHWTAGLLAGAGGLVGGYLGARLQPRLPEAALRTVLGTLAVATAVLYVLEALR
ncbi:TSUP family transporter [Mycobacterium sp. UM_Kg1]|uniref:TSUP family transporter n=1 Tax=Mycobacterium sp. UM_Kg1 TaxID=1545691 RepID=UPI000B2D0DEF|nr:TSUP family transporter [Mycobacterium sp. UM_Kg1]